MDVDNKNTYVEDLIELCKVVEKHLKKANFDAFLRADWRFKDWDEFYRRAAFLWERVRLGFWDEELEKETTLILGTVLDWMVEYEDEV